jgi:cysteine-rich repeat protein
VDDLRIHGVRELPAPAGSSSSRARFDDLTAFLTALTTCGDGIASHGEECDDGNQDVGDGCRPDCTIERCGDAIIDPGERCDDGTGTTPEDCSSRCAP